MRNSVKTIFIALASLTLLNCASKPNVEDVKLEKEVQAQPAREMHGGVAQKGFESILNSKTLTADQKKQLLDLHGSMSKETFKIQEETSKLKAVLFETVTQKPFDRKKVAAIKKKLVSLNDKKMKNMFEALDKVQAILGEKSDEDIQDFYRPFFWEQAHQSQQAQ